GGSTRPASREAENPNPLNPRVGSAWFTAKFVRPCAPTRPAVERTLGFSELATLFPSGTLEFGLLKLKPGWPLALITFCWVVDTTAPPGLWVCVVVVICCTSA